MRQVTSGEFEVTNFLGWDQKTGTFYYESNEGSPLRTAVYKTDAKGRKSCLTPEKGTNSAIFSTTFSHFMNTHSNMQTPYVVSLRDNAGKTLKTLVDTNPARASP